jgi:hypothetical protein
MPDQNIREGRAVAPIPPRNRATAPDPQEAPVGPTRTLPPDHPAAPRTPPEPESAGDALALDRPPTSPPAPSTPQAGLRYRGIPLDGTPAQLHRAVDQLEADTVPYTYYLKVTASREPAQAPPGRRTPGPLDAPREGVER